MNTIQTTGKNAISRLHPLVAVAAASVVLVSLLGAAAITGILPNSNANAPAAMTGSEQTNAKLATAAATPQKIATRHTPAQQAPTQVAAASPAPAQPAAAKENSPIGIGIGAVVGGLLGNQIGSGDGKTLATIAGAVGGGYVGNEIAKKQAP
jgi:uncharacterized protein YcfJ